MALSGTFFEIKRFGVHDGPGVRTVLFLKGCPLRCRWCHNPEGVEAAPELAFHAHKCLNCGECVALCPQGAHAMVEGRHHFERVKCTACGACAEACLGRALKLFGGEITVDRALEAVLEDREFYADGGGVTLSGGEPLLQPEFCAELFHNLKREGVHCALDTSGAVGWGAFETVLPWTDMVLYDVKHVDDRLHRQYVGLTNRGILDNLSRLAERGLPIEIRIPLIPGFNADPASIDAIAARLAGLKNLVAVRLLPYHPASSKFQAVARPDAMAGVEPPPQDVVEALTERLLSQVRLDTGSGR